VKKRKYTKIHEKYIMKYIKTGGAENASTGKRMYGKRKYGKCKYNAKNAKVQCLQSDKKVWYFTS